MGGRWIRTTLTSPSTSSVACVLTLATTLLGTGSSTLLAGGVADAAIADDVVHGDRPLNNELPTAAPDQDAGDPLFLTPYISAGQLQLARELAAVGRLDGENVPSYSGFLTVNATTDSNLFFWFFPALNNATDAPTLLWLQGGPGVTSLFGLFVEHGPYRMTPDMQVRVRDVTWAREFNVIYMDNPVGTGYSFTRHESGYVTTEDEVGRDLFEALQQFFTMFDYLADSDFYVAGESYAGKFVAAAAHTIHENRDKAKMKLAGISIGAGLCDPETMLDYADFLLQVGLIDQLQAAGIREVQEETKRLIRAGNFSEAYEVFEQLIIGEPPGGTGQNFYQMMGFNFFYNFLYMSEPVEFSSFDGFVRANKTRRAIHVGNLHYNDGFVVRAKLGNDFMRSVKPWIVEILENYKVLIYNGQLDVIVAAPLTASFVNSIRWSGATELATASRIIWHLPHSMAPAGYVRQAGNLTEALVRAAGHALAFDQPDAAYDLIRRFVFDLKFE